MNFDELRNKKIKVAGFVLMTVPATIEYAKDIFRFDITGICRTILDIDTGQYNDYKKHAQQTDS